MFGTVVATYFFLIAGFSVMTTLFALFTEKRFGYDAHANGYLFGFIGIITVIIQGGLIGRLVKMFGETNLARAGLLITSASLAFMPWCGNLSSLLLRLRRSFVRQRLCQSTLERSRLADDRSELAGPRPRRDAIRREHGSAPRAAARLVRFSCSICTNRFRTTEKPLSMPRPASA